MQDPHDLMVEFKNEFNRRTASKQCWDEEVSAIYEELVDRYFTQNNLILYPSEFSIEGMDISSDPIPVDIKIVPCQ